MGNERRGIPDAEVSAQERRMLEPEHSADWFSRPAAEPWSQLGWLNGRMIAGFFVFTLGWIASAYR